MKSYTHSLSHSDNNDFDSNFILKKLEPIEIYNTQRKKGHRLKILKSLKRNRLLTILSL